jgi:hypothetical protein
MNASAYATKSVIAGTPRADGVYSGTVDKTTAKVDDNFTGGFVDTKFATSMSKYLGDLADKSVYQVKFSGGNVVASAWAKNTADKIIGTYPVPRQAGENGTTAYSAFKLT